MREVTAFVCEFCPRKKRFAVRGTAIRHELQCFHNPARKACASCAHFTYIKGTYENDTGYCEDGPVCEKEMLNPILPGEPASSQYRSECEGWSAKPLKEQQ